MIPRRYVETSALLRVLLEGEASLRPAISGEGLVTSALTLVEAATSIAREPFPVEPVRSLDAIHLASVRVLDDELGGLEVVSCDDRVRRNAEASGFRLVPEAGP